MRAERADDLRIRPGNAEVFGSSVNPARGVLSENRIACASPVKRPGTRA